MKFKTEKTIGHFYGYEFTAGIPTDVTDSTIILKCKRNPLFKEVRAKRDSKRTVRKDS